MKLAWGAKVSADFARRAVALCMEIGVPDTSWLMGAMAFETGRTFAANKTNAISGATGLIQFMPTTAQGLGTTTFALARMTAEDQLAQYVRAYFLPFKGRLKTLEDVYMAILWPKAVGESNDFVLFADGSKAYLQNKGLDVNADGSITKAEAAMYAQRLYDEGMRAENVGETDASIEDLSVPYQSPQGKPMGIALALLPLIAQLIPGLVNIPKIAAAIPTVGAAGGSPHASDYMPLVQTVVETFTKAVPGAANEQQAVAMAQADPAVAAVAAHAVLTQPDIAAELAAIAPTLDKIATWDAATNAAVVTGRESALRAQQADNFVNVKLVIKDIQGRTREMMVALGLGVIAAIAAKGYWPTMPDYAGMLIPTLALIAGQLMGERKQMTGFFLDGTPASNATALARDAVEQIRADKQVKA